MCLPLDFSLLLHITVFNSFLLQGTEIQSGSLRLLKSIKVQLLLEITAVLGNCKLSLAKPFTVNKFVHIFPLSPSFEQL